MKAWVVNELNNKNNLKLEEKRSRKIKPYEVKVSIKACGLNNKDSYLRKGKYFQTKNFPIILGSDISGTIIEIGANVKNIQLYERVLVAPIMGCNSCSYCFKGEENKCYEYESILGGLAEEIIVNINNILPIPDYLSFVDAAALPISYLTAWNMLYNKISDLNNKTILFWGASSGVGTAGILLFNHFDNSIALTGSRHKEEKLKKLGVKQVINYKYDNIVKKVLEYTNGSGVDIIFDPIGAKAWETNKAILKNNGIHVNCARSTGAKVELDLSWLFSNQIQIIGAKSGSKKDLTKVLKYLNENKIYPIIDKIFQFQEAEEGLQYLEEGNHFGKIIINLEG